MRKATCIGTLDEYLRKNVVNNDIIRNKYMEQLRKNNMENSEEIIMKTTTTTKRTGAGRKKREVTTEMIADLSVLPMDAYCEKHNCGEIYFLTLYYKNVAMKEKEIVTEVVEKEVVKEVEVDMFEGILVDTHILYEQGFTVWLKHISEQQQKTDWAICDIRHNIQLAEHTQAEKIALFDMMKEYTRRNAIYDDAYQFAHNNKHKIIDLLELQKTIKQKREFLKERKYSVRVLTKEFGENIKGGR